MSDADINHTEEMERAYHEAWVAMKEISPEIRKMSFMRFAHLVGIVDSLLRGDEVLINFIENSTPAMSEEEDIALVNEITDPNQ